MRIMFRHGALLFRNPPDFGFFFTTPSLMTFKTNSPFSISIELFIAAALESILSPLLIAVAEEACSVNKCDYDLSTISGVSRLICDSVLKVLKKAAYLSAGIGGDALSSLSQLMSLKKGWFFNAS